MDNAENTAQEPKLSWLDKPLNSVTSKFSIESLIIALILILAVISRFTILGERVMSHDEINHVVPSWTLYQGDGYAHDPITHGPMQFHLVAATYFLFGDSDFTSRIPSALFSIATIAFVMFGFRRYLGRTGSILAGLFFLISPYMLFYGRYTRNEAFVALFGVVMIYAVLHYLEKGKQSDLFLLTAVLSLHFCTKETSYIYTAQLLIFLAVLFIRDVTRKEWISSSRRDIFIVATMTALFFLFIALGAGVISDQGSAAAAGTDQVSAGPSIYRLVIYFSLALTILTAIFAAYILIKDLGWNRIKDTRSFDLLILTITLILPLLVAFPIKLIGYDPLDYSQPGLIRAGLFLLAAFAISFALGIVWKPRLWLANMALFYAIFTVFYTTFFTNGQGFFTGMIGSLGYWLSQQSVNRGSQPWFYFPFLQVPMYEYLPALGTIVAFILGIRKKFFSTVPAIPLVDQLPAVQEINGPADEQSVDEAIETEPEQKPAKLPILGFFIYWSVTSLIAYSLAGEKMPWLTVHISLAMILSAAFAFGYLIDTTPFKRLLTHKGLLAFLMVPIFIISLSNALGSLIGPDKPFAGNQLTQLQTTSTFIFAALMAIGTGFGISRLLRDWRANEIVRIFSVVLLGILAILTGRSAYQASFINYDTGKEFLVYAHAARGPKDVYEEVSDLSMKLTGGKDIKVAYIGDALYPYWWYFRDFPNKVWLKDELTRDLLNYQVVISDDEQLSKTEAILKDNFYKTDYKRLLWPMQDYFNLSWKGIWDGIRNPAMLEGLYQIWLNKDYRDYSTAAGKNYLTLETWEPSQSIHLFVRKDTVQKLWQYGTVPAAAEITETDPYAGKFIKLVPDQYFGSDGTADGSFTNPRGIAIAPDGSIYVADSRNHRIQKFNPDGEFLLSWGTYASVDLGEAPGGTFNEPWGIAVAPDGSVFVADTWNYRVQKFSPDGKFIKMWGTPGPADSPTLFWGPRSIAIDQDGLVLVTDTGNNRIVVFTQDGEFVNEFGKIGINPGEFDEPVGIALDNTGRLYVVDTWNQRIQVFFAATPGDYQYEREWTVAAWYGQSINNKPYIALDADGNVYVTDPDAFRVLEFDNQGNLLKGWGEPSSSIDGLGSPCGIAVDSQGKVWVSDADNNFILRFTVPQSIEANPQEITAPIEPLPGLTYDQSGVLLNELGMPVYQLNSEKTDWVPIIPEGVLSLLPPGSEPVKDENGNWKLYDALGTAVFQWDPEMMIWISISPTPAQ